MLHELNSQYWDERYKKQLTGWDLGEISTPIKEYANQITNKNLSILIPGCGNAYEAEYLLNKGFTDITLIDIAPGLVQSVKQKIQAQPDQSVKILCEDFFHLDEKYDLILEQTFFCALDPALREAYVIQASRLLKPHGKIVGVMFNRDFEGGPPFGGHKDEYLKLFETHFHINTMEPCYNSVQPRMGSELFVIMEKK